MIPYNMVLLVEKKEERMNKRRIAKATCSFFYAYAMHAHLFWEKKREEIYFT